MVWGDINFARVDGRVCGVTSTLPELMGEYVVVGGTSTLLGLMVGGTKRGRGVWIW